MIQMPTSKRIAVVIHENDPYPFAEVYLIWALVSGWRAKGIEVIVQRVVRLFEIID